MSAQPKGELAIQTLAMPANTNANGDIFGGWMVSQMDLAGAVMGKQISNSRVVTVAINTMVFYAPVEVGDLVSCYTQLLKIGTTSMTIRIEAWKSHNVSGERTKVTEGDFVYVAIDQNGKPQPVKQK